jgi:lysophospholipase L1-like esterase
MSHSIKKAISPIAIVPGMLLIVTFMAAMKHPQHSIKTYTYLALGDSYTIGEKVPVRENFPNQVYHILATKGISIQAPQIIAKTGWTTDELQDAIKKENIQSQYDFVSLLIGVNNQYRGRSAEEYATEFESLLRQAIQFAGNDPSRVMVLSIPDWGVTPYAFGRDREQIAREIDAYNAINKKLSARLGAHYIDITPGTREASTDPALIAEDGLHPSGKEYARWAARVAQLVEALIGHKQ